MKNQPHKNKPDKPDKPDKEHPCCKKKPHCCQPPEIEDSGYMIIVFYIAILLHKTKNKIKDIFKNIF